MTAALLVVAQLMVGGLAYLVPRTLQAGALTGQLDRWLVVLHWIVGIATLGASATLVASVWGSGRAPRAPEDPR
jgi:hypothetical protein